MMKIDGESIRHTNIVLLSTLQNNEHIRQRVAGNATATIILSPRGLTPGPAEVPAATNQQIMDKRPAFGNLVSDYHLLENLNLYSRFCENFKIQRFQMAQSLARAIGKQNEGKYSVMVYDYLLAIPEYPPTVNGRQEALIGEGRWCNMICYKSQLFGVVVFPATEHVTFYFPEFSSYSPYVQQLIFTYGNKLLRYCSEKNALAFDFRPNIEEKPFVDPIMLTATLKRKMSQDMIPVDVPQNDVSNGENNNEAKRQCNEGA